jgi:Ca2+:H+ antiporter
VLSEILVEAIEPTIEETGISRIFIGLMIVPIVGNIAEHLAAVKVAWNGQLDFAMGIAFNSALQVALGVSAIAVFAGLFVNRDVTLVFTALEIALLVAATVISGLIANSGSATWIEGAQLLGIYVIAGLVFWHA